MICIQTCIQQRRKSKKRRKKEKQMWIMYQPLMLLMMDWDLLIISDWEKNLQTPDPGIYHITLYTSHCILALILRIINFNISYFCNCIYIYIYIYRQKTQISVLADRAYPDASTLFDFHNKPPLLTFTYIFAFIASIDMMVNIPTLYQACVQAEGDNHIIMYLYY